ncbi:MAG: tetratricopeptide repeat protein, partial [Deltaproteobacteria bacterium]|nr:tetratricopeptide repeat protein [Deltaproteobacteria bacterium]
TARQDSRVTQVAREPESLETPAGQSPIRVLYSRAGELPRSNGTSSRQLSVPGEGRLLLGVGSDRVAVGARSKIEVLKADAEETRIKLFGGSVTSEVDPRGGRGSFAVEVRGFVVKVIGTRFMVSMLPDSRVQVAVDKGRVEVVEPDETLHIVSEGQVLEFGEKSPWSYSPITNARRLELNGLLSAVELDEQAAVAEEDIESEAPTDRSKRDSKRSRESQSVEESASGRQTTDINEVRTLILEGRYARAEAALGIHLKVVPDDVAGWSLLATCRRKAGKWREAVAAYRRVIERGKPQAANAARFDAAVLLQDKLGKHSAAGSLLKVYLEGPLLLEAEALLRLARIKLRTGQEAEARLLLQQIVERHRSTSAAIQAARLLNEMDE